MRTSIGVSFLRVLWGARLWTSWEKDCMASAETGIWSDECGRVVEDSFFSAGRTGRMVQGTFCDATRALGSHGVMATWCRSLESGRSPFSACDVSPIPIARHVSSYLSCWIQETSQRRDLQTVFQPLPSGGRPTVRVRKGPADHGAFSVALLRGWRTPLGASMIKSKRVGKQLREA